MRDLHSRAPLFETNPMRVIASVCGVTPVKLEVGCQILKVLLEKTVGAGGRYRCTEVVVGVIKKDRAKERA